MQESPSVRASAARGSQPQPGPDGGSRHYRFAVRVDPTRSYVHYTLEGFFDQDGVMALGRERQAKIGALTCGPNMHVTLADIRALNLQSQAVLPAFAQMIGNPALRSRRLAFVTGNSLARMQIRRLSARPEMRVFAEIAEAEAWLFRPTEEVNA